MEEGRLDGSKRKDWTFIIFTPKDSKVAFAL